MLMLSASLVTLLFVPAVGDPTAVQPDEGNLGAASQIDSLSFTQWRTELTRLQRRKLGFQVTTAVGGIVTVASAVSFPFALLGCSIVGTDAACGTTIAMAVLAPAGLAATATGAIGWGVTGKRLRRHLDRRPARFSLLPGGVPSLPGSRRLVPSATFTVRF